MLPGSSHGVNPSPAPPVADPRAAPEDPAGVRPEAGAAQRSQGLAHRQALGRWVVMGGGGTSPPLGGPQAGCWGSGPASCEVWLGAGCKLEATTFSRTIWATFPCA